LLMVFENTVRVCNVAYDHSEKMGLFILIALVVHCSHPTVMTTLNRLNVSVVEHYLHAGNIYMLKAQRHKCRFTI